MRLPVIPALMLLLVPATAWGQPAQDEVQPASAIASPMIADPENYPAPAATPSTESPPGRLFYDARFDLTWLPGAGRNTLGIADLELATPLKVDGWAPLTITPYAAAHDWTAPRGLGNSVTANLPSGLYDLNIEFAWRPRLAEWLFADVALTPGLYTDFKDVRADSFMMRGRALAIVAFSKDLQLAAGGMDVNRNKTKFLPAGGVIWNPSEDSRCFLVFPQPKMSHRFATVGDTQFWGYVAGEFGGGRWEMEHANGMADSVDYTDLRVLLGIEAVHRQRLKGHLEVGYVFARRVNFTSATPDYKPQDTVMFRAGLRF